MRASSSVCVCVCAGACAGLKQGELDLCFCVDGVCIQVYMFRSSTSLK